LNRSSMRADWPRSTLLCRSQVATRRGAADPVKHARVGMQKDSVHLVIEYQPERTVRTLAGRNRRSRGRNNEIRRSARSRFEDRSIDLGGTSQLNCRLRCPCDRRWGRGFAFHRVASPSLRAMPERSAVNTRASLASDGALRTFARASARAAMSTPPATSMR